MRSELAGFLKPAEWVSSKTLTKKIKISRQALHKQISLLRKMGYEIQAKPKLGYRLIQKPDLLLPDEIQSGLKTKLLGQKILHFQNLDSTQNKAKELAEKGEPEGTLVIAEEQSAGRGRLGRRWESPRGGIWCSLILRPSLPPQNVPVLSLVVSIAVAKAIEENALVYCGLKWPNDVLISDFGFRISERKKNNSQFIIRNSQFKKVCGILLEMSAEAERVNWVAVGIGMNVNNPIPEILKNQAIALKNALKTPLQRIPLMQSLLAEIEKVYAQFLREGFAKLRKEYLKKSVFLEKQITVLDAGEKITGKFMDIAEDGSLILSVEGKKQIQFVAGEIIYYHNSTAQSSSPL